MGAKLEIFSVNLISHTVSILGCAQHFKRVECEQGAPEGIVLAVRRLKMIGVELFG